MTCDFHPKLALARHDLDPISPHHPVCLTRYCGHVITVNSQALALAGITSVHPAKVDEKTFGAYMRLCHKGELPLRFHMMVMAEVLDFLIAADLPTGFGDPWLRVGPLKIFVGGGLGARTAAQTEPLQGEPDNYGILWMEQEPLNELVLCAHLSVECRGH